LKNRKRGKEGLGFKIMAFEGAEGGRGRERVREKERERESEREGV